MGLSFTAIDFETANEQRASVCSVGVAVVRDGAVAEATSWLVQPPTGTRFTNTRIHGITASRAGTGSLWADSVEAINQYAGDGPLVAYNSPFDKGVYAAASRACEVDVLDHVWRDARVAAKTHLVLDSYRLTDVTQHLGLGHFDHHDAQADAVACANVVLELARRLDLLSLEDVWPTHFSVTPSSYRRIPLPATNASANPAHPLHGASVTFTGDLLGYTRNEARAAAAALGATVTSGPTRNTDVVVVGGFEPSTLRPGAITSIKLQKAMDLRDAGHRLELISEADFVALIAFDPEAG